MDCAGLVMRGWRVRVSALGFCTTTKASPFIDTSLPPLIEVVDRVWLAVEGREARPRVFLSPLIIED